MQKSHAAAKVDAPLRRAKRENPTTWAKTNWPLRQKSRENPPTPETSWRKRIPISSIYRLHKALSTFLTGRGKVSEEINPLTKACLKLVIARQKFESKEGLMKAILSYQFYEADYQRSSIHLATKDNRLYQTKTYSPHPFTALNNSFLAEWVNSERIITVL